MASDEVRTMRKVAELPLKRWMPVAGAHPSQTRTLKHKKGEEGQQKGKDHKLTLEWA